MEDPTVPVQDVSELSEAVQGRERVRMKGWMEEEPATRQLPEEIKTLSHTHTKQGNQREGDTVVFVWVLPPTEGSVI